MPKIRAKVIKSGTKNGQLLCILALNRKAPMNGEMVSLKWGSERTLPQNALYWKFLDWLINDAGLKDKGHFCNIALHDNFKAHFKIKSTNQMDKVEFGEYFDKVDELVKDFFEIDTAPFWEQYKEVAL